MSWTRLWNVLKTSQTCLEDVFQDVLKTLRIRLEDLLKTSLKSLEEVLKMSWRGLEDVFKTPSRHLEDVWPRRIYWSWPRRLRDDLKTSPEDVRLRRTYSSTYSSWSRSLEDVFKTSSEDEDKRRLQDVFKTSSSRCMYAGKKSVDYHGSSPIEDKNNNIIRKLYERCLRLICNYKKSFMKNYLLKVTQFLYITKIYRLCELNFCSWNRVSW